MMNTEALDRRNAAWLAQAEYRLSQAFIERGYEPDGKDHELFEAAYERLSLTVGKATAALAHGYESNGDDERAVEVVALAMQNASLDLSPRETPEVMLKGMSRAAIAALDAYRRSES